MTLEERMKAAAARQEAAMQRLTENMTKAAHATGQARAWALTAATQALEEARAAVVEADAAMRARAAAYDNERRVTTAAGLRAIANGEKALAMVGGGGGCQ